MNFRMSPPKSLSILAFLLHFSAGAAAMAVPFDTGSSLSRTVVIWIDDNVDNPASVGNNLEFAFNGIWSSDGTTGTIVVDKDDVIAAFAASGLPGTPADTANWSDLIIAIDIATGEISSMMQSGTVAISGLGDQPFNYDLNTTLFDTTTSTAYTQTGFADVTFGPETFTGWCSGTNAGQIAGLACPAFSGPAPFGYNPATGRFNAIGATNLNSFIFAYSTFGDAQLFEVPVPVPGLSQPLGIALALTLIIVGLGRLRAGQFQP